MMARHIFSAMPLSIGRVVRVGRCWRTFTTTASSYEKRLGLYSTPTDFTFGGVSQRHSYPGT